MKTLQSLWCKNWPEKKRVPNSWCKSTTNEFPYHPYIIAAFFFPGGFVQHTGRTTIRTIKVWPSKKPTPWVRKKPPSTPGRGVGRPCRCRCLRPVLPSTCHPPTAPSLPSKAGTKPGWRRMAGTTCFIQKKSGFFRKMGIEDTWGYLGDKESGIDNDRYTYLFFGLSRYPPKNVLWVSR